MTNYNNWAARRPMGPAPKSSLYPNTWIEWMFDRSALDLHNKCPKHILTFQSLHSIIIQANAFKSMLSSTWQDMILYFQPQCWVYEFEKVWTASSHQKYCLQAYCLQKTLAPKGQIQNRKVNTAKYNFKKVYRI